MQSFTVQPIGTIEVQAEDMFVQLEPQYRPALRALAGFSHLNILWWCSGCDNETSRSILTTPQPYRRAPSDMGIFATRSSARPNPIALTTAQILHIDEEAGRIQISFTDAFDGTPVLDLKPYTPSLDRVENPQTPQWCRHWPKSLETSGAFDWENEFLF